MSFNSPDYGSIGPARFAPVVLTPTYNNHRTLIGVLSRLVAMKLPVVVVDDGSTDRTADALAVWAAAQEPGRVIVVTHARNRGKAAALRTGFDVAKANAYTHVATIDTDGQLDPVQIPAFLAESVRNPAALIVGDRDPKAADYPARSLLGRRLSNWAIRIETGRPVSDSQCGLRVYPLELIAAVRCDASYFAFEAEVITRAAWAGFPILQVPADCRYLPSAERVSHFKPFLDTLRGLVLHARLLALTPGHRRTARRESPDADGVLESSPEPSTPDHRTSNPDPIEHPPLKAHEDGHPM